MKKFAWIVEYVTYFIAKFNSPLMVRCQKKSRLREFIGDWLSIMITIRDLCFHLQNCSRSTPTNCVSKVRLLLLISSTIDVSKLFPKFYRVLKNLPFLVSPYAQYSKSQIFVQKFNFDQTPTFLRVFHPNFFDNFSREIKVVNS